MPSCVWTWLRNGANCWPPLMILRATSLGLPMGPMDMNDHLDHLRHCSHRLQSAQAQAAQAAQACRSIEYCTVHHAHHGSGKSEWRSDDLPCSLSCQQSCLDWIFQPVFVALTWAQYSTPEKPGMFSGVEKLGSYYNCSM